MADPLLLNLPQAAELLGLTRTQLYGLTRNRSRSRQVHPVPYVRLGKRLMFRRDSLVSWINEMEGETR
jgi:predicted DNA-binding transcriptional regulator AlpA